MEDTQDVTRLLDAWRRGDPGAADRVFTIVYDDLRAIARRQLAHLAPGRTLVPTALVHEAYLRFADRSGPTAIDRDHFLGIAALAMRHVVIDYLRRRYALKRVRAHAGSPPNGHANGAHSSPLDLLAVDEALTRLAALDPRQARIVELRFFGGLSTGEIATALKLSDRTIKREFQKARSFLFCALH
jgi:RNA polymerase sigma factor (TIGR02999 family)